MTRGAGERWSPEQEGDPDEHRHASDCREEHGVARNRRPPAAVAGRAFLCTPTTHHSLLAMVITIRPARPDDAPGVRYVGTVSWPATYGSDKGAAYVMSGLDQFWNAEAIGSANQAGNIYVAESEQGIVGMVHVEELGADMVMWKLYVLPDHQLHGIGRLLVGDAKSHAGAHGKELVTEYDPSNERVRGFYLREGFEATASLWPGSDARWLRWTGVADQ